MPPPQSAVELQVKLLRVLEAQRLMRLGGDRPIDIDVRLILATVGSVNGNKKLAAKILGVSVKTLYNRLREYRSSSAS